ncbi:hypothetical protein [Streptomyces sp. NPDC050528]|uniref:hypothetical protein n=1 Tax=unclassified Streptomyces TaxID=2593676 RepID=UPI0037888EEF
MAWDEWEQLKADAAQRGSAHMRLNQLPADSGAGGGGSGGDLVVHQDDLGAVGHEAFTLHDDLRTAADVDGMGADKQGNGSTMRAAAELRAQGFAMGSALSQTVTTWTSQVQSLLQACAHISNHLDYTQKTHAHDDALIAASARDAGGSALSVSELDKYFK